MQLIYYLLILFNEDIAVTLSEIILLHDKSMAQFDKKTSIPYIINIEIIIKSIF